MFGRKKAQGEAIQVRLLLRVGTQADGSLIFEIDPDALDPKDPFAFGMLLVDAARRGAMAYSQALSIPEGQALARIWEGFDAERDAPTDDPQQIGGPGMTH